VRNLPGPARAALPPLVRHRIHRRRPPRPSRASRGPPRRPARAPQAPASPAHDAPGQNGARRTAQDTVPEGEALPLPASTPPDRDRPFFVIGQWQGGGNIAIWHVEEAPADPGERSDRCEEYREEADTAFGSVEIVYAASPQDATEQARREARETSERIHRDKRRE
jgi:hypothetical protein